MLLPKPHAVIQRTAVRRRRLPVLVLFAAHRVALAAACAWEEDARATGGLSTAGTTQGCGTNHSSRLTMRRTQAPQSAPVWP